jgi:predicted small lipoprotein YifL
MRRLLISLALVIGPTALTGCGYDGWVRYPCQSPENWERPDCQRPACEVTGTCPDYLLPEGVIDDADE